MTTRRAGWRQRGHGRRAIALLACFVCAAVCTSATAEAPGEVHGVAEAYAAPGVALAWGVLRGANDASTQVIVRIVADPKIYPTVAAIGTNPFSNRQQTVLHPTPTAEGIDIRVPRDRYADFPRTELRFYGSAAALQAGTPALTVFYLGVPDATPEFAAEANLDAYLTDRIARARAAVGGGVGK